MIQGGQPLSGGPQLNVNRIMQGFDDTLAAHPKTRQDDDETYTTIVRYEPHSEHPHHGGHGVTAVVLCRSLMMNDLIERTNDDNPRILPAR